MALYGSGYDSIAQQRQFYDNLALRIAEQQRVGQQQQFENQMAQRRFGASMQEAARAAAARRQAQSSELGNEQMRNLANILLRQEQIGVDRSRVQQQDRAAQLRALMAQEEVGREQAGQEYEMAQEAQRGMFGSGQKVNLDEISKQFPRLTPQMRSALGTTSHEFNQALSQNQRSVLGASSLLNQLSTAQKLVADKRRQMVGLRGDDSKALSSEVTRLDDFVNELKEQAKSIPNDIRARIVIDPFRGVAMPNQPIEPEVADSVEQWRAQAANELPRLEAQIKELRSKYGPGDDEFGVQVLPIIAERNRVKAAVDAGPIPFSTRWSQMNQGNQGTPEFVRVADKASGRVQVVPMSALSRTPNWQERFRYIGPE